jgi:glycosyltransferase involved in cell wall biosynthesis
VKVSVVIPTCNRAGTLPRALDSVFSQTREPFEVIVVDDGSSDLTRDLIERSYPGVDYHYQPNLGVSGARNAGIDLAKGDWLAFLDSDDEWLPGKLAAQCQALDRYPGYRICHTDEIWIRRNRRVNPMHKHAKSGGWIYQKCLPMCVVSPSSALIHKSVLRQVGMFDEDLPACEDYDLWLRICSTYPVLFLDQLLLRKYGGHADQLSRKFWGMDRFRVRALEKILSTGSLTPDQRVATREALLHKLRILHTGACNRDNVELVQECSEKISVYEEMAGNPNG